MMDWWRSLTQTQKILISSLVIVIIFSLACGGFLVFSLILGSRGNDDPKAVIDAPRSADVGEIVTFSAEGSRPGEGEITDYIWDFGDGRQGSGEITDYVYNEAGVYTVTLEILTDRAKTARDTRQISIGAVQTQDPRAIIIAPDSVMVGQQATFNGRNSIAGDSAIRSYEWDLGDGTRLNAVSVDHTYTRSGTFTISLTVEDDDGKTHTDTRQLVVTEAVETAPPQRGPVAVIVSPASGATGSSITFDARNSRAGSSPIQSYQWDFGDGAQANGVVITHTYTRAGAFNVTLTVTDNTGLSDTITQTIAIAATAPTSTPDLPTIPPPDLPPPGE